MDLVKSNVLPADDKQTVGTIRRCKATTVLDVEKSIEVLLGDEERDELCYQEGLSFIVAAPILVGIKI